MQLAGTADQLLPWLPDEVDRLEMRAAQMSKDSTQVLLTPVHSATSGAAQGSVIWPVSSTADADHDYHVSSCRLSGACALLQPAQSALARVRS